MIKEAIRAKIPVKDLDFDIQVNPDTEEWICHWRRGSWNGAFVALPKSEFNEPDRWWRVVERCRDELMRAVRLETVR